MILIKNADIYAPEPIGVQDILISNTKIIAIGKNLIKDTLNFNNINIKIIEANNNIVLPSYIDQHVHIIGGGGEDGFYSRTPEVMLSSIIKAGITTVIGVLGTDGTTRHIESLLSKARALEQEGISTYILTGSYEIPLITITGDARKDIILIDKIIGVGEVAISDHRSSAPTLDELKRISTQARLGGMLSKKAGVIQFHVGSGKDGIKPLFKILEETEIPPHHFIPTHINRSIELLKQGIDFTKKGGYIDLTSGIRPETTEERKDINTLTPAKAIKICQQEGAVMDLVTMTSDGNGSMATYDDKGQVTKMQVADMNSLHEEIKSAILDENLNLEDVFPICTKNPAKANGLYPQKGTIKVGSDADILFLDDNLNINSVMALGKLMMQNNKLLAKGTFE